MEMSYYQYPTHSEGLNLAQLGLCTGSLIDTSCVYHRVIYFLLYGVLRALEQKRDKHELYLILSYVAQLNNVLGLQCLVLFVSCKLHYLILCLMF